MSDASINQAPALLNPALAAVGTSPASAMPVPSARKAPSAAARRYNEKFAEDPTWKLAGMTLLGVALIVALPVALWFALSQISNAKASTSWPTVNARITKSEVEERRGRRGRRTYHANIEYAYSVDGKSYTSDRISYGGTGEDAEETVARFALGSTHEARYDPANPSESVLVPGVTIFTYLILLLPAACLAGPYLAYRYGMAFRYRMAG